MSKYKYWRQHNLPTPLESYELGLVDEPQKQFSRYEDSTIWSANIYTSDLKNAKLRID